MSNSIVFQPNILSVQTPQVAPLTASTVPVTLAPQPQLSTVVQPVVEPRVSIVAPTPAVQPVVTSTVQPVFSAPVVTPPLTASTTQSQLVPTPVLINPNAKPLTPSPSYEKFIPPTPSTTTLSTTTVPKIYQFYQYAPAPQGPAYATITAPITTMATTTVPVLPQYGVISTY